MTYAEAMARYGIGQARPALRPRAGRLHRVLRRHHVPGVPGAVRRRGRHARRRLAAAQAARRLAGVGQAARRPGLAYVLVGEDGELGGPVAKNLTDTERAGLAAHVGAQPGDCIFFGAGAAKTSRALLGAARVEIGRRCGLIDENAWAFLWVLDAPLFEPTTDAEASGDVAVGSGAWTAVHHAFTSPKAEFLDTFDTDPGSALAYAYDIVCNGNEIGGGSIRIHRADVQERVFEVMGLSQRGGQGEVRLPARGVRVRRPAARRHRVRLGPHLRAALGRRLDPRGHRLPQVRWRLRPADRGAGADHRRSSARRPAWTPRRSRRWSSTSRRPDPPQTHFVPLTRRIRGPTQGPDRRAAGTKW